MKIGTQGIWMLAFFCFSVHASIVDEFLQQANRGNLEAQYQLGQYFEYQDDAMQQDLRQAAYWYEQAAQKGHLKAALQLAWFYELGKGVARNKSLALYWMVKAASDGDHQAVADLRILQKRYEGEARRQRVQQIYSELVNHLRSLRQKKAASNGVKPGG